MRPLPTAVRISALAQEAVEAAGAAVRAMTSTARQAARRRISFSIVGSGDGL
jgi:hypothetical protein